MWNVESKTQDEQMSNGFSFEQLSKALSVCGCYRKLGCKFGCKLKLYLVRTRYLRTEGGGWGWGAPIL